MVYLLGRITKFFAYIAPIICLFFLNQLLSNLTFSDNNSSLVYQLSQHSQAKIISRLITIMSEINQFLYASKIENIFIWRSQLENLFIDMSQ
ncbi:hypothetical protein L873DRAFT_796462 [Choiromyces venosus 120613-1]|uniref:Uncharacterized protein n=1 Tax=Choiromyces venosus 120613-1 TaxID=1336337 RepID=A0A3N4K4J9_9PEZI|nr:hypothetical protein L873DRAFT_796462 [Choiromyces venosus 120613-1]